MRIPRLIACDVDGTLLQEGQTDLAPETAQLIGRLLDAGIAFVPASGRQYANLQRLFSVFADRLSFVVENGTLAFMDNQVVFRATMDHDLGDQIVRSILERPGYEVLVSGTTFSYAQPKNMAFAQYLSGDLNYQLDIVENIFATGDPYSKISAYHPDVRHDEQFWRERFGARCTIAVSGLTWLDLMPLGISKASGLQAVCERLGVDPTDCLAIGDNDNDVEMFDLVSHPIAMAGASEKAKRHAHETVASPNDIFSRILDELQH